MKHYWIKLLTQSGVHEVLYSEEYELEIFIKNISRKYGSFITISVDEFTGRFIDKVVNLRKQEQTDIKPFMITYDLYRIDDDKFEVTRTDGGKILVASCSLKQLMIAIRDKAFSDLPWE